MRLQFLRFESELNISPGQVTTLQIEDRNLFRRIVSSIESEQGEEAVEPYRFWSEHGVKLSPRKVAVFVNGLPDLPTNDRTILGKLYEQIALNLEQDTKRNESLAELTRELVEQYESLNSALWGTYDFRLDWSTQGLLRAFLFQPVCDESLTLLDNCIHLFGLCADVGLKKPLIFVNLKSFLSSNDLVELFNQAFFHGIGLLLLESWTDLVHYEKEKKLCVDLHFVENWSTPSQSI